MSHIWLGIFVVFNFTYLEIVDINTIYCIRLQIKNMHVKKAPVLWGEKRVVGGGGGCAVGEWGEVESSI